MYVNRQEFPRAPHFYPICFGKCCPPFTPRKGGPKGRHSILQNRRTIYSILGSLWGSISGSDGPNKLALAKNKYKLDLGGTSSN